MTRLSIALVVVTLLAGCGVQPTVTAPAARGGEAEARLLDSISGFVAARGANKGALSLGLTAKSLTGKTYTDEHPLLLADGKGNSNAFGTDPLLGKDGKIYVQGGFRSQGPAGATEVQGWFVVGTYSATEALKPGTKLKFKLTNGCKAKMHWKGINPMGDDFMVFQLGHDLKPIQGEPEIVRL